MTFKKIEIHASAGDGVDRTLITPALETFRKALSDAPPFYVLETGNLAVDRVQCLLALTIKLSSISSPVRLMPDPPKGHKLDPRDPTKWIDADGSFLVHVSVPDRPAQAPVKYKPSILISVEP